jgi:DASH complex subunit DAD2
MAYAPRPTAIFPSGSSAGSSLRQPSIGSQNVQQSSALAARIAAKRSELENLKQLKELSGALAAQMGALEEKLATLRDGTEGWGKPRLQSRWQARLLTHTGTVAVACVLSNWDNVLRAINMASSE